MNANIFYITLILSIIVQAVTGAIEFGSLFVKVPSQFSLIRQLLIMEILVQIVEGVFYIWLFLNLKNVGDITPKRYVDWAITTPTMLITLIFYLIYLGHKNGNYKDTEREKEKEKVVVQHLEFFNLIRENSSTIAYVLLLNWLMLLFGYLGEMKILSTFVGVGLGFIPFLLYYFIIYVNYAILSKTGTTIFWYFFIVWSLYGVVAVLPYYLKNSFYNILDLFAKNFFGIFLSYIILTGDY
jgi:hypothetical protein